jgi:parallel beta-helix repeat protein
MVSAEFCLEKLSSSIRVACPKWYSINMNLRFLLILALFGLGALFMSYFCVLSVYGSGIICIAEDGSISPPTAPLTRDGDVYTFTGDVFFSKLLIEKDNVAVDGEGHTIEALNTGIGVLLSAVTNITLFNLTIKNFEYGVFLGDSSNINISLNNIENNRSYGVMISDSAGNTISGNNIMANGLCGVYVSSSSENNAIYGNLVTQNDVGIHLYWSGANNSICQNTVSDSFYGIWSECSSNNPIMENNISNSDYGMKFSTACDSNVAENNIHDSITYGMSLQGSSNNNTIYHNNLVNNTLAVESYESTCAWDFGGEGNYWSCHTGLDANHDGISDTPFQIDEDNADRFPLCGPFMSVYNIDDRIEIVSNSTIRTVRFFRDNGTMQLAVTNSTPNQSFGFCRISIPHELIDQVDHSISVIIDNGETPTLFFNDSLRDDGYSRWIYAAYEHSAQEITVLTEVPLTESLLALTIGGATLALLGRKLKQKTRN